MPLFPRYTPGSRWIVGVEEEDESGDEGSGADSCRTGFFDNGLLEKKDLVRVRVGRIRWTDVWS